MQELEFLVSSKFNNVKAVDFLKQQGVSDEIIKKVKFGRVFVNGQVLNNVNNRLCLGNLVKVCLPLDKPNPFV